MSCLTMLNFKPMKNTLALLLVCLLAGTNGFAQTLPFYEDFENVGTTTTFTSSTTSINGLSEWSYEKTNQGRLRFRAGTGFSNGGSAAATMDVSTNNQYSTNYLILTLDLSAYTSSELELNFSYMSISDESDNDDRVWVRGSNTGNWVEIYDWDANKPNGGIWTDVNGLDIDGVLAAASPSQTVSSTFQVRFGQRDNYPARSTTRDDGVSFDDIEIVERFRREGTVSNLSDLCPGNNSVSVRLFNNGLDTIKSAVIDWSVAGQAQKSAVYTGSLPPGSGTRVTLGTASFSTGNNAFYAVCDSVNGDHDQIKGDTLFSNGRPGLTGSYTIGGSNADYATVLAAMTDLNNLGICGAVEFSVSSGTFSGSHYLGDVSGASATNTITFKGVDSSSSILSFNGNAFTPTLLLDGASYVTFEDLKIQTRRSNDAWVVRLHNGCENVRFQNCWISMPTTGTDDLMGIVASASGTVDHTQGDNVNGLVIDECNFTGGERGLDLIGSTTAYSSGTSVTNCTFSNHFYAAAYFNYMANLRFNANTADNFRSTTSDAILCYNTNNFSFERNNITSRDYAVYMFNMNLGGVSRGRFYNNMLSAGGHGVYFVNTSNTDVYHNTIVGDPALRFTGENGIIVKNNILYGNSGYAFFCDGDGFDEIDWNVYYSTETNKYTYDNSAYSSLSNWKSAASNINSNSVQTQPSIKSTSDLYLKDNEQAERAPSLGIAKDIDRDDRCTIAVSVGADESVYKDPAPRAAFALPDTAFQKEIVLAENNRPGALKTYSWYVDGVLVDSGSVDLNHKFSTLGRHKVTHYSYNCGGFDSLSKFIDIVPVQKAAVPSFTISKRTINVGESIELVSTSENGPSVLNWSISPYWLDNNTKSHTYLSGYDSVSATTRLEFTKAGQYTICLYAGNSLGGSNLCRQNVISVREDAQMCSFENTSTAINGTILDPGGTGNYPGFQRYNCSYTITPCAKDLTLRFISFDIIDNRDYLRIYDGTDDSAPALHTYNSAYSRGLTGDASASTFNSTLTANSGSVHLAFTTSSVFGSPGYEITWSGTKLSLPAPVADFEIPDSICTGNELVIDNNSVGQRNSYEWLVSSPVTNNVEYTDSLVNHFFFFAGKYKVRLVVNNCGGTDTMTKDIVVVDAPSAPIAKAHIDVVKPDVNQVVTLTDISFVKGYPCSEFRTWKITPASKVSYVSGFDDRDVQTKVSFSDTGCYTVQLIASNSQGRDTVTMSCGIRVVDRCVPKVNNLDSEVGISKLVLGTIHNPSSVGVAAYTDYRSTSQTDLILGQTYNISIFRPSGATSLINRRVWIDYNLDGDFSDAGELVIADTAATRAVQTDYKFRVPLNATIGGATLRVGVSRNMSTNQACGTNLNGEFEDYLVLLKPDEKAPVIYLNGAQDTTINQCEVWTDPSGYAIDNALIDTVKLTVSGTVDYNTPGDYNITYYAADSNGNVDSMVRKVTVASDMEFPVATLNGTDTVYLEVNSPYLDAGATYTDNCTLLDTTVTNTLNASILGTYSIEYKVRDLQLNESVVKRIIIVQDTQAPTIDSLRGGDTIEHQIDSVYIEKGIVYRDNYDPIDSIELTIKGTVDVNTAGEYRIWYILRDKQGNVDSTFRIVIVDDFLTPIVTLLGAKYDTIDVNDFHVDAGVTYQDYNGGTAGLTLSYGGTYVDEFGYQGQATNIGTYTIIYTVTNTRGGKSTEMRYVVVLDREAPKLVLRGANPYEMFLGETYMEPGWDWTDNHWDTPEVWIYTFGTIDESKVGTYLLYYYAADSSSNISDTLIRAVVVKDTLVSIGNPEAVEMAVFPNPNNGMFTVELSGIKQSTYLEVFDPLGRSVYRKQWNNLGDIREAVQLENAGPGAYILVLKTDESVLTRQIIVR